MNFIISNQTELRSQKEFKQLPFDRSKIDNVNRVEVNGQRLYAYEGELKMLPSVSTITSWHTRKHIMKWRQRIGDEQANQITRKAGNRGRSLHEACERYLLNDPNALKIPPSTWLRFKPIKEYLDQYCDGLYAVETQLFSLFLGVGGTVDCVASIANRACVIDFKTSIKLKTVEQIEHYFMQASAYAFMWHEMTGVKIDDIMILMVDDEYNFKVFYQKPHLYLEKFIKLRDTYLKESKQA